MLENNVQMKILKNKVLVDAILLVIQFCNLFVGKGQTTRLSLNPFLVHT